MKDESRINSAAVDSIVDFAARLIQLPSRAGMDSPAAVLRCAHDWLTQNDLMPSYLFDDEGEVVGLYVRYSTSNPGPTLCLNACLDTAPFGDEHKWAASPTSGGVADGWLQGRGAADSKTGAAILAHVLRDLVVRNEINRGNIYLLLDADEHTGRFGGVRAFLKAVNPLPDGAVLGYPENEELIIGSRGFYRVRLHVSGRAGHSGATNGSGVNAISKIAQIVAAIDGTPLPPENGGPFSFGPRATVTQIEGGEGFSQIPDRATCNVDIRLTPSFGHLEASQWLTHIVERCDAEYKSPNSTTIEFIDHWPAYLVQASDPLVRAFQHSGTEAFGRNIPTNVCGPSNIGNLLAAHNIPTICGLGVSCKNVHGTDESADISIIPDTYRGYYDGARRFLGLKE